MSHVSLATCPDPTLAIARVGAFAERLTILTVDEWLEVGRREIADPHTVSQRVATRAMLDAAIAAHGLAIAAWHARDVVETSVCLATNASPCWTTHERRLMTAAHVAAESAALALLARDALAPADVATLLAPFDHLLARAEETPAGPRRDRWTV
jgi:hypothetical protein